jgi:hypothetical protein
LAAARLSNSTMTVRWSKPCSYAFDAGPRTTNLPPAARIAGAASFAYAASFSGLSIDW